MAKPEISTRYLADTEFAAWNQFVAESPTGSLYARTEYLDALCSATGGHFRVLVAHQGEQLFGGISVYEEATRHGTIVSPRLLLYYNGPVVRQHDTRYPSEQTARHLKTLTALEDALRQRNYASVVLKPRSPLTDLRPFLTRGWSATPGYSYVVSIENLEQTRSRIEQNLRRLIDRCGRAELTFTADDDFDSFFRLHSHTMNRVDFRVYLPEASFRTFYQRLALQGLARMFHIRLPDGRAIASQFVLLGHTVTHTVSAGADPEHLKSGVTAFLRWKSLEHLAGLGYTANDLTDASLNPVTHFKSQLGGELVRLLEIRGPETARYRMTTSLAQVAASSRGAAGALLRRVARRGSRDSHE